MALAVMQFEGVESDRRTTPEKIGIESAAIAAFVMLGFVITRMLRPTPAFPLDDPFIALHSAQVMHWGSDPNFPGVNPLYGATSAPFVGLVYLLLTFLSPLSAIDVACWLGILAYMLGLRFMGHMLNLPRSTSFAIVALGVFCSFVPYQLLNGLETGWALAAITWTLALASGGDDRWPWAALAAGLAASIRPDLLTFAVLVLFVLLVRCWRTQRYQQAALLCAIALAPIALTALWYHRGTGFLFPQTGFAKRYFFAEAKLPPRDKFFFEIWAILKVVFFTGPLVVVLIYLWRSTLGKVCLLFMALFCLEIFIAFPGAMNWNGFRYPIVLVPIFLFGLATIRGRIAGRILAVSLTYSLITALFVIHLYVNDCRQFQHGAEETAAWCNKNIPARSTIMIHDAGYIAYGTNFKFVDMVGLKTPAAILLNRTITYPSMGESRSEAVSQLAKQTGCQYLILLQNWPPTETLIDDMKRTGWEVQLLHQNEMHSIYRIRAVS